MDPLLIAIGAAVGLTVFSAVMALAGRREGGPLWRRLRQFQTPDEGEMEALQGPLLRQRSYSGLPILSMFLAQFRGSERTAVELERAGLPLRVGEYYLIRYGLALVLFLAPFLFSRQLFTVALALILAAVGYMLPALWVSSRRKARLNRINTQLVDMLGLVSNSLRSGYGLMQSFEFAAQQMGPPLATELRRMLREVNLGLSAEEALRSLGERVNSPDLDMVLTAINIQRNVGGNLAEILDNVAFTMRERERIRGEIRTLTAQQRMTGIIIGGLPIGIGLLFLVINPEYMSILFTDPVGRMILLAAAVLEGLGIVATRRIMAIEV